MHRQPLLIALEQYRKHWLQEKMPFQEATNTLDAFINFVQTQEFCFERSLAEGHVTGAAVITTVDLDRVLMTHHKKLNRWLQLGGHSDGDPDTAGVSLREAQEESGLCSFEFFGLSPLFGAPLFGAPLFGAPLFGAPLFGAPLFGAPLFEPATTAAAIKVIFDIDIHSIPARGNEAEHLHYDVRYLLVALEPEKIAISDESLDLKWFDHSGAYAATQERSMHRQFEKLEFLRRHLK